MILCVIPALLSELKQETIVSLNNQTVPINYIVVLAKRNNSVNLPMRISNVLNDGLQWVRLECFDYLLRLDADTILPNDFVEKHIALNVDVVGGEGYAQLIKVKFFVDKMKCSFNFYSDDTYTYCLARACGSASERVEQVGYKVPGVNHSKFQYDFYSGKLDYMVGYDPFSLVVRLLKKHISLPWVIGYFCSMATNKPVFEFAKNERSKHLSSILRSLKV